MAEAIVLSNELFIDLLVGLSENSVLENELLRPLFSSNTSVGASRSSYFLFGRFAFKRLFLLIKK